MNSLFWHKLKSQGTVPSPREGLSLLYTARLRKWILFGGTGDRRSSEVFIYDPVTGQWESIEAEGNGPKGRGYHVAWIDDVHNVMFVHGGQGEKRDSLSDIYALDLDQWIWKKLYIIDQPSGRAHHAACKLRDTVFLYGGCSAPENLLLDDLWSFVFFDIDWSASGTEVPAPGWVRHKTKGSSPGPRKGHTLCSYQDTLILFGGVSIQKYSSDLYILNVSDMRWHRAQPRGKGPSPRAFHATAILDNNCIAIFGGVESLREGRAERLNILNDFYILDLEQMHWSVPIMGGYCPSRRYGHAMCWGQSSEDKSQLLLLGGLELSYCPIEVYSLEKTEVGPGQAWQVSVSQQGEKIPQSKIENTIHEQMKKINELQTQLSMNRDKIVILENEKQVLSDQIEQESRESAKQVKVLTEKITVLEARDKQKTAEISSIKNLLDLQTKREKMLIDRTDKLEDAVKKAESLLITLDHSFAEMVALNNQGQLRGLTKERMEEISQRKKRHQESLVKLRDFYMKNVKEPEENDKQIDENAEESQEDKDSLQDSLEED